MRCGYRALIGLLWRPYASYEEDKIVTRPRVSTALGIFILANGNIYISKGRIQKKVRLQR
jgi:hypothetical protein